MGLTINYKLSFKGNQEELVGKLISIRSKCLDKPFEEVSDVKSIKITKEMIDTYHFWQAYSFYPNNSPENLQKRNQALRDLGVTIDTMINLHCGQKLTLNRQVVAFSVWAGVGCEDFQICLIKNKTNNKWYGEGFCKTQYAEHFIRCHLLIIDVLEMLKQKGFEVIVKDEGEYWETRDLKVLAKNINDYTGMLISIGEALKEQVKNTDFTVECEIDKSQNIIDIKE